MIFDDKVFNKRFSLPLVADLFLKVRDIKNEDLENTSAFNQVSISQVTQQDNFGLSSRRKDVSDDILEAETRGLDFKGNVRYFCPKCNVRYIGKLFV